MSSVADERPCTYMTAMDAASETAQRSTTNRKYIPARQSTNTYNMLVYSVWRVPKIPNSKTSKILAATYKLKYVDILTFEQGRVFFEHGGLSFLTTKQTVVKPVSYLSFYGAFIRICFYF